MLDGALGRAVMKVSAVAPEHRVVTAPARVFDDQGDFLAAFDRGELDRDLVAVSATRARARTACPSCTSSRRRWAC